MTELRDARFKQALESAPDADVRPAPAVAQAIRAAARQALPVAPAPTAPPAWWQRLWQSTGSPRAPWGAAFASLLLALLVTVMWVHEPIPDARPIAPALPPPVSQAKPAAPEAPATAPTPAPAPVPVPVPVSKSAAEPQAGPVTPPAPAAAPPVHSGADDRAAGAMPPLKDGNRVLPPYAEAEAAASGRARELQAEADTAAQSARAKALAAPAAMPGTAARASSLLTAQQSSASSEARDLMAWTRVDQVGIAMEAHSGTARQADAQALLNRLQSLLRQGPSVPAMPLPDTEPLLRLSLRAQGAPLASLSLWAGLLRWQREGEPELRRPVQADEVQALLLLARQALAQNTPPPR